MASMTSTIPIPWIVVLAVIGFLGLVSNVLVVCVVVRERLAKGFNTTMAFVANLSVSDALYSGLAFPFILASTFMTKNWDLGKKTRQNVSIVHIFGNKIINRTSL